MANDWGDVELDVVGMRALAHPVRLAILTRLREHGPDTATGLSPFVGASPSVASWHLRHLAEHGLVEDAPGDGAGRKRWWQAVGKGFRFTGELDPGAYRQLTEALHVADGDVAEHWRQEVLPTLPGKWAAAAGRWDTTIIATRQELAQIDAAVEALLTPYVQRKDAPHDAPKGARVVRVLRQTMPTATSPQTL